MDIIHRFTLVSKKKKKKKKETERIKLLCPEVSRPFLAASSRRCAWRRACPTRPWPPRCEGSPARAAWRPRTSRDPETFGDVGTEGWSPPSTRGLRVPQGGKSPVKNNLDFMKLVLLLTVSCFQSKTSIFEVFLENTELKLKKSPKLVCLVFYLFNSE